MFKKLGRFPGRMIVPKPTDEVFQLAVTATGIKDFVDFPLFLVVDDNGRRRRMGLAAKRIGSNRLKEWDVEDRMDPHGRGKLELKSVRRYFLGDSEFAKALEVELRRGASGLYVPAK
jgi:hypothetical protein